MRTSQLLDLVGQDVRVPTARGDVVRYVNLDYAASTPPLLTVKDAVEQLLPWYSSVHRGAGYKSQLSTAAYEAARQAVSRFCGARPDDTTIFTRNTTDALNLLASALPAGTTVIAFEVEHHANLLPWRRSEGSIQYLPAPTSPEAALTVLEDTLRGLAAGPVLVTVTGASNVTGEVWPIADIVDLAHRFGARVLVDAAQLAPHFPIDLGKLGADYVAFSGHKMYAPFGAGVLVGRSDWLAEARPFLYGGGAVSFVTLDDVLWTSLPDRQEAGSPNVVGAVALGVACEMLAKYGMERLAVEEMALGAYAREALQAIPGIEIYALWDGEDVQRLGIVSFNLAGMPHGELAVILSAEYGIGVRHGCFCAHPYLQRLLRYPVDRAAALRREIAAGHRGDVPGAVRMSVGVGSTRQDIDALVGAVEAISRHGSHLSYRLDEASGEYVHEYDWPVYPNLPFPLAHAAGHGGGEAS
ncbi:MAG TPA: aminotransferase class V-fold PLP-dependent enzyme [Chloroflexota bacterium]|nr:aminotransferase class V-fold PLP-dependent enzyme [Chloroflexota bacterium]